MPSIDDALATIERLGGSTTLDEEAVGEMGFVAEVHDPEGYLVGLWETAAQP